MKSRRTSPGSTHGRQLHLTAPNATDVGRMLEAEYNQSVDHRTGHPQEDSGSVAYDFDYMQRVFRYSFDPGQIVRTAEQYRKVASAHPGWEASTARALIEQMVYRAARFLFTYRWSFPGAPSRPACASNIWNVQIWNGMVTHTWELPGSITDLTGIRRYRIVDQPDATWTANWHRIQASASNTTEEVETVFIDQYHSLANARTACVDHLRDILAGVSEVAAAPSDP